MGAAFADRPARPGERHEHAAGRQPARRASADRLRAAAPALPADLRPVARADRRRGSGRALRGGSVYTDDRAPVEWLVDTSILQVAAHGER